MRCIDSSCESEREAISTGEAVDGCESSSFIECSEATESTLVDSRGTSEDTVVGLVISMAGVVAGWACGSQQSISRVHTLQLKFSSRRPSSTESAHLEKTAACGQVSGVELSGRNRGRMVLTSPHSKQVLHFARVDPPHLLRTHTEQRHV